MHPRTLWPDDPVFIEIGVTDVELAQGLRQLGYTKYLGVFDNIRRAERLQKAHPDTADRFTYSDQPRLVLHNNAEVLVLSGWKRLYVWRFRYTRHANSVAWRFGFNPLAWLALLGCLIHAIRRRYALPRMVTVQSQHGKKVRLLVSRVRRQKLCYRHALHFIPHKLGLSGMFREFDRRGVQYVVLRWFEALPDVHPSEDVDMLIADESLPVALEILHWQPGIQLTDVYSESGLPRSDYCSVAYYPPAIARRILESAIRHKNLCYVPSPAEYFHSLAYHAVYHKGIRSGLSAGMTGLQTVGNPEHDYTGILQAMASQLGIQVEISLEGLHAYLQKVDWAPTPDALARLAAACPRNRWLQLLAKRLSPTVHDQGLGVFVLRQEAVRRGFKDNVIDMITKSGFEILAVKELNEAEAQYAASRIRGGNWSAGPYACAGGPPNVAVVVYDRHPITPNRKQRRRFPQRTNARLFIKENIRQAIAGGLPSNQQFNALHSSDHAAEAWHLIDVLCPELADQIHSSIGTQPDTADTPSLPLRQSQPAIHQGSAAISIRRAA